MSDKAQERIGPAGGPLNHFKAAVGALVEMRESGKCAVFLGKSSSIRFVLEGEEFREALSEYLPDEKITAQYARELLKEVRNYLAAWEQFRDKDRMLRFLEDFPYRAVLATSEQDEKNAARLQQVMRTKIDLVDEQLLTEVLRERARRLGTATAACLEDIEFEIVERRHVELEALNTEDPFLRVRIRYTGAGKAEHWFLHMIPVVLSWGEPALGAGTDSFEVECDFSDIDLMITRLREAKDALLGALEEKGRS